MCVIWLGGKYCRWNCATPSLEQIHSIHLHRECCKTNFIWYFPCDRRKFNLTGRFFIFLFTVTGEEIIFICSTCTRLHGMPIKIKWKMEAYFTLNFKFWEGTSVKRYKAQQQPVFLFLVLHQFLNQQMSFLQLSRISLNILWKIFSSQILLAPFHTVFFQMKFFKAVPPNRLPFYLGSLLHIISSLSRHFRSWDYPKNFVIYPKLDRKNKPGFSFSSMCMFAESNGTKS